MQMADVKSTLEQHVQYSSTEKYHLLIAQLINHSPNKEQMAQFKKSQLQLHKRLITISGLYL